MSMSAAMADQHDANAAMAAHASTSAVAPLAADPAGLSQPLHLLRIARAEGAAAAVVAATAAAQEGDAQHSSGADVLPWLNAPATAAAPAPGGDDARVLAAPAAAQPGGSPAPAPGPAAPAVPVLLTTHLAAVRRLQAQVPVFKHQLRALLDCWMDSPDAGSASAGAVAAALAAGQDTATAALAGEAAAKSLVARHAEESTARSRALRDAYAAIVAGLSTDKLFKPPQVAYAARHIFGQSDRDWRKKKRKAQRVTKQACAHKEKHWPIFC